MVLYIRLLYTIHEELYMPTNKTPFTFHINDDHLEKLRFIAKKETRSVSNLIEHICIIYIKEYELENGTIEEEYSCF